MFLECIDAHKALVQGLDFSSREETNIIAVNKLCCDTHAESEHFYSCTYAIPYALYYDQNICFGVSFAVHVPHCLPRSFRLVPGMQVLSCLPAGSHKQEKCHQINPLAPTAAASGAAAFMDCSLTMNGRWLLAIGIKSICQNCKRRIKLTASSAGIALSLTMISQSRSDGKSSKR